MSRTSVVTVTWTCDVCGSEEPEVNGYSPKGWQQVAHCAASAQLGNFPAKHLCRGCAQDLDLLLSNCLGDTGDMAIAWDEGMAAFSRGQGSDANPYRAATTPAPTMNGDDR